METKMYNVTNKLEQKVKYKDIVFGPKETKVLDEKPKSDKFYTEKLEKQEKKETK